MKAFAAVNGLYFTVKELLGVIAAYERSVRTGALDIGYTESQSNSDADLVHFWGLDVFAFHQTVECLALRTERNPTGAAYFDHVFVIQLGASNERPEVDWQERAFMHVVTLLGIDPGALQFEGFPIEHLQL